MKRYVFLLAIAILSSLSLIAQNSDNIPPKHEFRATWFATVTNIDWPSKSNLTVDQQKAELNSILNSLRDANINAVCFQVRSQCDAFYKSEYEPWAAELTGTRGEDPGYDPLQYAIEQAHARGIEIHVWVNPFRVVSHKIKPKDETPGEQNSAYRYHPISTSDLLFTHTGSTVTPEMVIEYTTDTKYDANKQVEANTTKFGQVLNPGYEGVRQHIVKVILDIVKRYDIDGVVMDDYFYAYGGTYSEDAQSKALYKPSNVKDMDRDGSTDDDWRRANVDSVICKLYKAIQEVKPWVRFGMGVPGSWSMKANAAAAYGISLPAGISAMESYDYLYCNALEWAKQGWVDYLNPQIYWSTQVTRQDYDVLCKWWAKTVCENFSNKLSNGQRVHFFASQAAYGVTDPNAGLSGYGDGVLELQRQIDANRANLSSGYTGSVFFHTTAYMQLFRELKASHFQLKALPPPMGWKAKESFTAPTDIILTDSILSWSHPTAERFTVYAFPRGMSWEDAIDRPEYLYKMTYNNYIDLTGIGDISKLTIAVCTYDRYGIEHAASTFEGTGVFDHPAVVFWELNGGVVDVELPTYVTETYILPIPRKDGCEFGGWYNSKALRGKKFTEIPAGWKGTLYAKWAGAASNLDDVVTISEMRVYDIMGRFVGNELPKGKKGVFVIIQDSEKYKIRQPNTHKRRHYT